MATKYKHTVEIIHEGHSGVMEFTFTADENTDPSKIFEQFIDELSIIVQDVEELEFEDCDGCSDEFDIDELIEDENAGLKFCNNCQKENQND
jgi:hypothetical protein